MKQFKYIIFITPFLLLLGCEEELRDTSYAENFPSPSNLVVDIDIATDSSGLVVISPSAEGANSFMVDFGNGTDPLIINGGVSVSNVYDTGIYTVTTSAISISGESIQHTDEISVLAGCIEEEMSNKNPSEGDLNITFQSSSDLFRGLGSISIAHVDNPSIDFSNTSCKVQQFVRTTGCQTYGGALLFMPSVLEVSATGKKRISVEIYAEQTAEVTLLIPTTPNLELVVPITKTNEWEQIIFDLSAVEGQSFNRFLFYIDREQECDDSVYFIDNFKQIN